MSEKRRRLHVHEVAQELYVGVVELTEGLPRGFAELRDQARRAAHSTVRNLTEGEYRIGRADKRSRYVIARGEVGECDSCLDSMGRLGIAASDEVIRLRKLADRVGAMLYALIKRWS